MHAGTSLIPALFLHGLINTTMELFPLLDTSTGEDWEPWLFANIFLGIFVIIIVVRYGKSLKKD